MAKPSVNVVTDALVSVSLAFDFRLTSDGLPYWRLPFANDVTVELAVMDGWLIATAMADRPPDGWSETGEVFQVRTPAGGFGVRGTKKVAGLSGKTLGGLIEDLVAAFPEKDARHQSTTAKGGRRGPRTPATKRRGSGGAIVRSAR